MKKILFIVMLIIVVGFLVYYQKAEPVSINNNSPIAYEDPIIGCYVATLGKDVYSLKITSQSRESFVGSLVFKNFEKDSSSGPFVGTYKDGVLLGEYSFQSEGTFSIMQVIFKKSGSDFIRGYGPVNETGDRFVNLDGIIYDFNTLFKASSGVCATSL